MILFKRENVAIKGAFVGESSQTIRNWKTREIPENKVRLIAKLVGIDADWLEFWSGFFAHVESQRKLNSLIKQYIKKN